MTITTCVTNGNASLENGQSKLKEIAIIRSLLSGLNILKANRRDSVNGRNRADIKIGAKVKIVLKVDQRTGKLTEGVVDKLLTKSSFHPHGIKVMLKDGKIGRVQEIL